MTQNAVQHKIQRFLRTSFRKVISSPFKQVDEIADLYKLDEYFTNDRLVFETNEQDSCMVIASLTSLIDDTVLSMIQLLDKGTHQMRNALAAFCDEADRINHLLREFDDNDELMTYSADVESHGIVMCLTNYRNETAFFTQNRLDSSSVADSLLERPGINAIIDESYRNSNLDLHLSLSNLRNLFINEYTHQSNSIDAVSAMMTLDLSHELKEV